MIRGRPILRFSLRGSGASGEGIQKGQEKRWRFVLLYTPDEFVRRLKKRGGLH